MNDPATREAALLVVDDNKDNQEVLAHRLRRIGYQVTTADSGREALALIEQRPFDLVLLDVMMPEMDGLEVLGAIRESRSMIDLPVILVTARVQSGDVTAALQMGANDYVTKPLNFPVALARINNQLAMRRAAGRSASAVTLDVGPPLDRPDTSQAGATVSFGPPARSPVPVGPGRLGEYELLGELGRGGMGVVFKARHRRLNRLVAVKVIGRGVLENPTAIARFYKEAESAARLAHPNVVMAYDAGQQGDTHYFAMEYVDGRDLDSLVRKGGPLPVADACDYVRQAALGLQHAFEKGLVHRDIKPANLLVTRVPRSLSHPGSASPAEPMFDSVIKILDFGLARVHSPNAALPAPGLTGEGSVLGTADYMAPEQWVDASGVDIRADLYSLGCTFYFLLVGRPPFPGDRPMEKMLKHSIEQPAPPEQARADVPPSVGAVLARLMAKRADDRYQTPAELVAVLEQAAAALPPPSAPAGSDAP
jgi:serine/threonine protein kinase/ActR/RegA family two-component response regulator